MNIINYNVTFLDETTSTNTEALALGLAGAKHLSLVIAKRQTAARGRLGRSWAAPAGNVFWSALVRPAQDVSAWGTLGLIAGLAVQDALAGLVANKVCVKWPNDVLVEVEGAWRKISGVLVETAGLGTAAPYAVVGVGINVALTPEAKGATFAPICVQDLGVNIDAEGVIQVFSAAFLARYQAWEAGGFAALLADYNAVLWHRGEEVRVSLDATKTEVKIGVNEGVRADGALVVGGAAVLVGDVS